ncbi:cobalt ECF transporter T component CbiQ [Clostridium formicaceticum]|uniref:Cobalt ECF transporter T component CbiQ n=1 Tax=Clostridium formicaceticum TaxID=1497 RepID=A0AAC9RJ41_9CLOT|nr:cobalt ECF transporter T component CbiQ [Clostridium formicaceticum]AOY76131.1 cobalt ECF transporter T component CbiQ [Clostridium formicaceticum]ARE86499.1 Cobalt transport protein CbiQ [Clostridium formicaceticum]
MYFIDHLAYSSSLRKVEPNQKFIFSLSTMLVVLLAKNYIVPIAVILFMGIIIMKKGGTSAQNFVKALFLPFFFLVMGVLPVMLQVEIQEGFKIYGTWKGFYDALFLVVRALAAVTCLYFFILTTPMVDTLQLLKKYKCPILIRELMFLMYRFIMLLTEITTKIFFAQKSRGGYYNTTNSRQALSQLVASLFLGLHQRSKESYQGLIARGYQGEIDLLIVEYENSPKNWCFIMITQVVLVFLLMI